MNKMFRPQAINKAALIKMRRLGDRENYNFVGRIKWYPASWVFNRQVIGNIHSRMHHLACHAPEPVAKQWRAKYNVFMNKHFGEAGNASMRYLNKWTCHSWM